MKRLLVAFIISIVLFISSFGQESYIKGRWNIKAGYSRYTTNRWINQKAITVPNYRVEANFGIFNSIETGVYLGYSKFESIIVDLANSTITEKNSFTPFFGINCNLHLLPILVKADDFRFDLYMTGKLGAQYYSAPKGFYPQGYDSEYCFGGGASFYLTKHLGIYAEYTYGKYFFKDNEKVRYGLTVKF